MLVKNAFKKTTTAIQQITEFERGRCGETTRRWIFFSQYSRKACQECYPLCMIVAAVVKGKYCLKEDQQENTLVVIAPDCKFVHQSVIQPVVLPFMNSIQGCFQQDNARPRSAVLQHDVQSVEMQPWPARSPDLSAIEHVWISLDDNSSASTPA
ncbi:hypothetical protein AVEN_228939-1 [Araneus ventricosus]|uniref:Uncharacterized protein n=1 Tax=Araneus ventricosus TaxID=182803 RepID=A0A4Y2IG28_ARAVE|nr:hypothetical protein AVEN_228939-1 [Araneus ventricosus]